MGGIQIYAGFNNKEEAFGFDRIYLINEKQVIFRHIGLYTCENCGEKGHQAERCDEIKKSIARATNRRKKVTERKKKRQVDQRS